MTMTMAAITLNVPESNIVLVRYVILSFTSNYEGVGCVFVLVDTLNNVRFQYLVVSIL